MASQNKPQSKRKVEIPDWAEEVKPSEDVMAMFYAPTGLPKPGPLIPVQKPEKEQEEQLRSEESDKDEPEGAEADDDLRNGNASPKAVTLQNEATPLNHLQAAPPQESPPTSNEIEETDQDHLAPMRSKIPSSDLKSIIDARVARIAAILEDRQQSDAGSLQTGSQVPILSSQVPKLSSQVPDLSSQEPKIGTQELKIGTQELKIGTQEPRNLADQEPRNLGTQALDFSEPKTTKLPKSAKWSERGELHKLSVWLPVDKYITLKIYCAERHYKQQDVVEEMFDYYFQDRVLNYPLRNPGTQEPKNLGTQEPDDHDQYDMIMIMKLIDDLIMIDPLKVYERLTGNALLQRDMDAYRQVETLSPISIKCGIAQAVEYSKGPIGSFSYCVKVINEMKRDGKLDPCDATTFESQICRLVQKRKLRL